MVLTPLQLTSDGHHWRPVHNGSLEDLHPYTEIWWWTLNTYGCKAGGTHLTGMLSCFIYYFSKYGDLQVKCPLEFCILHRNTVKEIIYLPSATKLQQGNIFTGICQSFCSLGCLPQYMVGYTSPRQIHPLAGTFLRQVNPPGQVHPLACTPPGMYTPGKHTPPPDVHCSGRYASHWNAFLFLEEILLK